jgi:hypothetical protein
MYNRENGSPFVQNQAPLHWVQPAMMHTEIGANKKNIHRQQGTNEKKSGGKKTSKRGRRDEKRNFERTKTRGIEFTSNMAWLAQKMGHENGHWVG